MRKYPINFVAVVYSRNGNELVRSQKKRKRLIQLSFYYATNT